MTMTSPVMVSLLVGLSAVDAAGQGAAAAAQQPQGAVDPEWKLRMAGTLILPRSR